MKNKIRRRNPSKEILEDQLEKLIDQNVIIETIGYSFAKGIFYGKLISQYPLTKGFYLLVGNDYKKYSRDLFLITTDDVYNILDNKILLKLNYIERESSAKQIFDQLKRIKNYENYEKGYYKFPYFIYANNISIQLLGDIKYDNENNNYIVNNISDLDIKFKISFTKEAILEIDRNSIKINL